MEIGIFAYTFVRPSVHEVFDAIQAHGLTHTEWNYRAVNMQEVPATVDLDFAEKVRRAATERNMIVDSVAGYINMVHPDPERRREAMQRLCGLIRATSSFGANRVALCTGTRDPDNMWRWHPANDDAETWQDLCDSMGEALQVAEENEITLVFEPEVNNVVHSAKKARQLLDEMASPWLKVVFDGANIYHKGELARQREILSAAVDLLGDDIVLAHAKDITEDGDAGHAPAGHGKLDYAHYIGELRRVGYDGTILLHGLEEADVAGCVRFLHDIIG